MLFVSSCDGAEVFDLAKETLDLVAVSIQEAAEGWDVFPVRHRFDASPRPTTFQACAHGIGIISAVGEQDLTFAQTTQHIARAAPVMGLSRREFEDDRQAVGIHQGVDFGRQAAS